MNTEEQPAARRALLSHPDDIHSVVYHLVTVAAYCLAFWLWLHPEASGLQGFWPCAAFTLAAAPLLGWIGGIDVGVNFHNHTHRRIFTSQFLNRWFARCWTPTGGWPAAYWRHLHVTVHHAHLLEPRDWTVPATMADGRFESSLRYQLRHWPWRTCRHFYREIRSGRFQRKRAAVELVWFLAIWSIPFWIDPLMALCLWVLPHWCANCVTLGRGMYVQHAGCEGHRDDPAHPHSNNFVLPFYNLTMFNIGYHAEHHDHPEVHWSDLPDLHDRLAAKPPAAPSEVNSMRTSALIALPILTALLPAQKLRWQLPERGGAIYERKLQVDSQVVPQGAHVPDLWLTGQQPGTLLHGELDADRLRRAGTPADWRELLPQLAFDLGQTRAGKLRTTMKAAGRFQPVRIEVEFSAIDATGEQAFTGTIEFDGKAARGDGAAGLEAPKVTGKFDGRRRIDADRGIVSGFDGRLDLLAEYPAWKEGEQAHPLRRRTLRITDDWREPQLVAPDDPAWNLRIAEAIRSSLAHLKEHLKERLGQPFRPHGDPYHDVQPGELALTLLALRRGGEDAREPTLAVGFEQLRRLVIEGTYSLAVAILAFEALYTPPSEWADLRAGRLRAPMARALPPADLQLVQGWAKELLDNVDTTVDVAYLRRWHYGPSRRWDNSNMQYALLGLYAAQLCGVEISPVVWTAAANHWLRCSVPCGEPIAVDLQTHRDLERAKSTRTSGPKLQPRGWGYYDSDPTGSMTTAGITGLTVCSSALRLGKKGSPKLLAECDDAIRAGFVWFQQWLSVRHNPRPSHGDQSWHLYYLYGLERACELNQIARIAGRDWYTEGAIQLVATQQQNGSWGSSVDTAFGLLFLKKTALPVFTGR